MWGLRKVLCRHRAPSQRGHLEGVLSNETLRETTRRWGHPLTHPLSALGFFIFHHFASSQLGAVRKAQKGRGKTALIPHACHLQLLTDAQFCFPRKCLKKKKKNLHKHRNNPASFQSGLSEDENWTSAYLRALFIGCVVCLFPRELAHTQKHRMLRGSWGWQTPATWTTPHFVQAPLLKAAQCFEKRRGNGPWSVRMCMCERWLKSRPAAGQRNPAVNRGSRRSSLCSGRHPSVKPPFFFSVGFLNSGACCLVHHPLPQFISVHFSRSVLSSSLRPHGLQHAVFPAHHQLPEPAQTHVSRVSDAIQPSHPLSSPSPPAFSLSKHQGLFQWVSSLHQGAKGLEFQFQHQSFQWIFRTDFL